MDTLLQQVDACPDLYAIRQLVFVNSAAYAYTEIRVDQHTALFGRNNLGKTSMLNALKLFLLPEENFKKCDRKFGFRSRAGDFYSTQDSFGYYFPEQNSLMLLEAENLYGSFCILLHQGRKEFSYARMVVPCAFSKIRHLFWDFAADCNQGLGAPLESLSLASILSALQSLGGEALHGGRSIRERLFSHRPLNREEGRFCLLPLKQGGTERELAAWKQLIHLAFDISANDTRTLPDALATIIEGEKQRKAEQLSVDLNQILQDYEQLRAERENLQRISNARDDWEHFEGCYSRYETHSREVGQFYVDLKAGLEAEQLGLDPRIESATEHQIKTQSARNQAKTGFKQDEQRALRLEGKREGLEGRLKASEHAVKRIGEIQTAHPDLEPDALLDELRRQEKRKAESVEALKSDVSRQRRMEQLISTVKRAQQTRNRLRDQLDHHKPSVLEQLDSDSATLLHNLLPVFAQVTPCLGDETKEVVQGFARLFSIEQTAMVFQGEPLPDIGIEPYDPEQARLALQQKVTRLDEQIKEDQAELETHQASGRFTQAELKERLRQEEVELSVLGTHIEFLKARDTYLQQFQDAKLELATIVDELTHVKQDMEQWKLKYDAAYGADEQARKALDELKSHKQKLRGNLERLALLNSTHAVLRGWASRLTASPRSVANDSFSELERNCRDIGQQQNELMAALRKLLQQQLLDGDGSEAYLAGFDMAQIVQLRKQFERVFNTLDGTRMDYDNRVRAHNKHTSIQMDALRDAGQQISGFIAEINQQFGDYKVSNLDEIVVACDLHPRFQMLLDELGQINLKGEDLHDERLYQRLNDFCNEFFRDAGRNGMVLQMQQLIEKVRYRFRIAGQDQFTENAQSNGTTSMVNSLLLAILLKRLLARDARICLPLVMDEMASLDQRNLKTAADIAEEHGFVLFGASPDISAEIVQAVKHYVYLGMFQATERAYSKQRRVVYHGTCEQLRQLPQNTEVAETAE